MSGEPLLVRYAIGCGYHYDVWVSAEDARSVWRWAAILIPVYAVALFGLIAISGV